MGESEYKLLVNSIIDNCPEEHKNWLKRRLANGNEQPLRRRLKDLISPIQEFVGNEPTRNKLILQILNTRNYLTHYSTKLEGKALTDMKLVRLSQKLEAIFQLTLLQLIGFSKDDIKNIFKTHYSIKRKLK